MNGNVVCSTAFGLTALFISVYTGYYSILLSSLVIITILQNYTYIIMHLNEVISITLMLMTLSLIISPYIFFISLFFICFVFSFMFIIDKQRNTPTQIKPNSKSTIIKPELSNLIEVEYDIHISTHGNYNNPDDVDGHCSGSENHITTESRVKRVYINFQTTPGTTYDGDMYLPFEVNKEKLGSDIHFPKGSGACDPDENGNGHDFTIDIKRITFI